MSEDYAKERGLIGEDIHEGKRTLMVLNSYWNTDGKITSAQKDRLIEILGMQTTDPVYL